jgi:class 3 adenylate cyclase
MTVEIQNKLAARPKSPSGFVLVVDDEEHNRTLLRDPLEARGYEVEEAENGRQALQKIARRHPDVILLDLMMPEMDGLEVCRVLRRHARTAHIPILMITALSERGDRLLGIVAGANDFLNKPIDLQDVMLRVGNAAYAKHLYDQLQVEQEKSERLLLNILPKPIAARMKSGEINIADSHAEATVLLADLVGFTTLSATIDPAQIVQLLNEVFSAFDVLTEKHGVEKIKTIGGSYMAASGISTPRPDHAEAVVELAISLRKEIERFNHEYDTSLRLRIGISSGPVVAGIIGRDKFAYDIWGETVNLAFRLNYSGEAAKIQISESTYERLKDKYQFEMKPGGGVAGQDNPPAYWLGSRTGPPAAAEKSRKAAARNQPRKSRHGNVNGVETAG